MKSTKKCDSAQNKTRISNKRRSSAGMFYTSSAGAVTSLILILVFSFVFGLIATNNTYAEYTISMTSSGAQVIDVLPSSSGIDTQISSDAVTVTTTCPSGYNLTTTTSVTDNNLYLNGSSSNNTSGKYFTPSDGITALSSAANTWGFYQNGSTIPTASSVFSAVPSSNSTAATIRSSTNTNDSFNIYYGVAVGSGLPSGSYKMIPDSNNPNADGTIVYYLTMDESCSSSSNYMQDATDSSLAAAMPNSGDSTTLYDKRDESDYQITNIDGRYWMTQNLRITNTAGQATGTILAQDSNFSTDLTFKGDLTSGNSYPNSYYHIPTASELSTLGLTAEQVGVYYNYCAASAGTICQSASIANAAQDICPAGWHLPTQTEFASITSQMANFSVLASGNYYSSALVATPAYWWGSTGAAATTQYRLRYNGSALQNSTLNRRYGSTIRCIKNQENETVTVNFEGTVTSVTFSNATYGNQVVNTSGGTATLKTGVDYTVTMTYSSGTPSWHSTSGAIGSTTTNPTTYSTTAADTLTASTAPFLTVTYGTGIGGVIIKSGSPAGSTVATVTATGTTLLSGLSTGTQYYLLPLYSSGYTLNKTTATGGTVTSGTYGYYYYSPVNGSNTLNITASKLATTSSTVMQSLSTSTCTAKPIPVKDNRDSEVYFIQRLADGKCWMLENLRLGSTSTIALTASNTNIASDWTLPASKNYLSGSHDDRIATAYTNAFINVVSKTTTTTDYGPGRKYIGVYYNYCAASAGTYCYAVDSSTGNAAYDICPKGWRMPTTSSYTNNGEYQILYGAYSSNATNFRKALSTTLSGYYDFPTNGKVYSQGSSGYFWSSSRNSNSMMYSLNVSSSSVKPNGDGGNMRYNGSSIRCILK